MSSTGHAHRRGGNRWRHLILYVLIGAVMTGVALAGYTFLGPHAAAAAGSRQRPAAIATDAPSATATSVTGEALGAASAVGEAPAPPRADSRLSASDLAVMYAEMADMKRQMDTLMDQAQTDRWAPTSLTPPGDRAGSNIPLATPDTTLSTLNEMLSTLHGIMAIMDEMTRSVGNQNGSSNTDGVGSMGHR